MRKCSPQTDDKNNDHLEVECGLKHWKKRLLGVTRSVTKSSHVPVNINPFMTVLHHSDSVYGTNYQMGAYVYPRGESVVGAEVISPVGDLRELEYNDHLGQRFSTWWNDRAVEDGLWEIRVYYENGSKTTHTVTIDGSNLPGRPTLIYPLHWVEVDTTTPTMEFSIPDEVSRVMIRVYEVPNRYAYDFEERFDRDSLKTIYVDDWTGSFIMPEGILQLGMDYAWRVYVMRTGDIPLTYDALSDLHYFSVISEE